MESYAASMGASERALSRLDRALLQFRRAVTHRPLPEDAHQVASRGFDGSAVALPHRAKIQAAFGHHDVSSAPAYVGGKATAACDTLGAAAYASQGSVAFADAPDLFTAAHEAAHLVQQRAGVHLLGGVGRSDDAYERHADAVAVAVVEGRSAEALLDAAPTGGSRGGVQRMEVEQDRAWFEEQKEDNDRFENIDAEDFLAEYLAKDLAYRNSCTDYDKAMLRQWGYQQKATAELSNSDTGLYVARFDPAEDHPEHISFVAFRGTEFLDDIMDIVADLHGEVGSTQYNDDVTGIRTLLKGATGNGICLTGHSLGGALAQRTASELGNDYPIRAVTTFQSAGIDEETIQRMRDIDAEVDVKHFQVTGDLVSKCGDGHIDGEYHVVDDRLITPWSAHREYFNYDAKARTDNEQGLLSGEQEVSTNDPTSDFERAHVEAIRDGLMLQDDLKEAYDALETLVSGGVPVEGLTGLPGLELAPGEMDTPPEWEDATTYDDQLRLITSAELEYEEYWDKARQVALQEASEYCAERSDDVGGANGDERERLEDQVRDNVMLIRDTYAEKAAPTLEDLAARIRNMANQVEAPGLGEAQEMVPYRTFEEETDFELKFQLWFESTFGVFFHDGGCYVGPLASANETDLVIY